MKGTNIRGMESLCALYKIGRGPSSSHTMGPERICRIFSEAYPQADAFSVTLYGSLAKTGRGHATDYVITKTLAPTPVTILFDEVTEELPHPNTMEISAISAGREIARAQALSVGGGRVVFQTPIKNAADNDGAIVYPHQSFAEIRNFCAARGLTLSQYAHRFENEDFDAYLATIWETMKECIAAGLCGEGLLPGGLKVQKKAKHLYHGKNEGETETTRENRLICSYAFAVSEQNACGERIVTAPTCGASGVLPAVLYHYQTTYGYTDTQIFDALSVGGIIGNLIKTNASISGAECGCQAEVGTACAMTAAALGTLQGFDINQIEYAAEIAIEHHLGLTCDPICGLVQIPCIERNAVAAMRAINAVSLAGILCGTQKISFDDVTEIMRQTGLDLSHKYKETAVGGLASIRLKT